MEEELEVRPHDMWDVRDYKTFIILDFGVDFCLIMKSTKKQVFFFVVIDDLIDWRLS